MVSYHTILSEEQIELLQTCLRNLRLESIELEPLMSNEIYRISLGTNYGFLRKMRSFFITVKWLLFGPNNKGDGDKDIIINLADNKVLCPFVNKGGSHRQMVLPIIEKLGSNNCSVLCFATSIKQFVPENIKTIIWDDIPIDRRSLVKCLRKNFWRWNKTIKQATSKANVRYLHWPLFIVLLSAIHSIFRARVLLNICKPRCILVSFDRWEVEGAIVQIAKQHNIPTFTLVHGAMNLKTSYTPVIADKILVWGESQRRKLISWGIPNRKIELVGYQRLSKDISADPEKVYHRLGITNDMRVVVVVTDPLLQDWNNEYVRIILSAVDNMEGIRVLLRLHPAEHASDYMQEFINDDRVIVRENADLSLDEVMAVASVLIVRNSTVGGEALIKGRPVIVYKHSRVPLRYGQELVKTAGVPLAENIEELSAKLIKILNDPVERKASLDRAAGFVKDFACAYGDEATNNIVRLLLESSEAR